MGRNRTICSGILVGLVLLLFALPLLSQTLAIPGFNQAYRGPHGYWGACRMGTAGCPDRIETAGCLITSLAAVLDYYGITLTIPAAESCTGKTRTGMDPGILNDWLKTHGGYGHCATDHTGNCCLEWTAVPSAVTLSTHENRATPGLDETSRALIDQALARGYPVIAGVHWGAHCHGTTEKSENCHWVVITGKSGLTYTITDPYNRDKSNPHGVRTTLAHGVFGPYTIDRFVVVKGPVPTPKTEAIHLALARTSVPGKIAVILSATTGGKYLVFVQVVGPEGTVYYERRPNPASLNMQPSSRKASLIPGAMELVSGKNVIGWLDIQQRPPGRYTLLVRLEDPRHPGKAVATAIGAVSASSEAATANPAIGVEIVIAVGLAALVALLTSLIVLAAKG